MAVKNKAQVIIGGKVITLSGYESEEYLHQVASYMNRKITELGDLSGFSRLPMETRYNLLSLNITDDYFKAKRQAEDYEQDLSRKDQEMYDLKHELIDVRMKLDEALKAAQDAQDARLSLEARLRELERAGLAKEEPEQEQEAEVKDEDDFFDMKEIFPGGPSNS